jgi:hypothetical protein
MTSNEKSRRYMLAMRLKSAIATAAIVGTMGGWVAFGTQPATTAVVTDTAVVAQVATSSQSGTTAQSTTSSQSSTTAQLSTSSSQSTSRRGAVTTTRSSR